MRAMVLHSPGHKLQLEYVPDPEPTASQILIAVEACGVCRTDLHIVEGAAPKSLAPLLCAGLIGYRALRLAGNARRIDV